MNNADAEKMAQMVTECYASTRGCKRLPIRMLIELPAGPDVVDAEMVMLCVDHAATYKPDGKVISDKMLISDENLKMFKEFGL